MSSPVFLTALLGLYVFSVTVRWAPAGGMLTPGQPFSIGDLLAHLVLPAFLLSIAHGATIMRYMRSSLLEVLSQDYVRTARAKGVREFWVVVKHAVRNALLPVITLIGSTIGIAIGGAIFIESVFNWPGMGLLMINAVDPPRLSGHHVRDAARRRLRHHRQPPDRHRLRGGRSADQGELMAGRRRRRAPRSSRAARRAAPPRRRALPLEPGRRRRPRDPGADRSRDPHLSAVVALRAERHRPSGDEQGADRPRTGSAPTASAATSWRG